MKIIETEIRGVYDVLSEPHCDSRGFFARIYCPEEFAAAGIIFTSSQINLSRNDAAFTLRGMHWQAPPHAEAKLVRAMTGVIHDVVVDLRQESPTYLHWLARRLSAEAANALFIPEGCAHGFMTLEPNVDVLYQMNRTYAGGFARGIRWDDPSIGIEWPAEPQVVSDADQNWPRL